MSFLLTFIAFNFIIIVHELGHFIVAKRAGIKVQEFSLFVGPRLFGFQRGDTMYSLRLIPALAYVKMEGEDEQSDSEHSFGKKPLLVRMAVIAAGPLANLVTAFILFTIVFSITGYSTTYIDLVTTGSPAYNAGIRSGDKILKYDNKKILDTMNIIDFMYVGKGKTTEIEYSHAGSNITKTITPAASVVEGHPQYMIGVTFQRQSGTILGAAGKALSITYSTIRNVAFTLKWLISGEISVSQMAGPVGVATMINSAAATGLLNGLYMTAFISVAIGATNLVPFPALDGSKLLLMIVEGIRRKSIPAEKEAAITLVGFALLMILVVITTYNDILRGITG